jgi:hypothetical protein
MNRLAMAEKIARLVPMLAKRDSDEWKRAEQLRTNFVADYSLKRIAALSLDEYVIGKGAENRSFCYRIEREMDILGKIVGSPALRFGIYYGRTKNDPTRRYRYASRWGNDSNEAFAAVKQAVVDLLQAAAKGDSAAIDENALSPMFKGKILFLYHPDQFAPIYSKEHLEHFITELDLNGSFECEADMQRALMDYCATWPELKAQPAALYMRLLYDVFGPPDAPTTTDNAALSTPMLKTAVDGAQFIGQMPALPPAAVPGSSGSQGKINHAARQANTKRIGDRGELVVLALEKQRLIAAGQPKLADDIDYIAERNDFAGYDILSFDEDGTERPIEVKATTAPDLQNGFYITAKELEKSGELANYHLYIVFSALSKSPRVFRMKQPNLKDLGFELEPLNYHVTHSGI